MWKPHVLIIHIMCSLLNIWHQKLNSSVCRRSFSIENMRQLTVSFKIIFIFWGLTFWSAKDICKHFNSKLSEFESLRSAFVDWQINQCLIQSWHLIQFAPSPQSWIEGSSGSKCFWKGWVCCPQRNLICVPFLLSCVGRKFVALLWLPGWLRGSPATAKSYIKKRWRWWLKMPFLPWNSLLSHTVSYPSPRRSYWPMVWLVPWRGTVHNGSVSLHDESDSSL